MASTRITARIASMSLWTSSSRAVRICLPWSSVGLYFNTEKNPQQRDSPYSNAPAKVFHSSLWQKAFTFNHTPNGGVRKGKPTTNGQSFFGFRDLVAVSQCTHQTVHGDSWSNSHWKHCAPYKLRPNRWSFTTLQPCTRIFPQEVDDWIGRSPNHHAIGALMIFATPKKHTSSHM